MNDDAVTSGLDSDTMQVNEPPNEQRPPESDFLDRAADEARRAALAAWNDLNRSCRDAVDPRVIARTHPWLSLGVASAVGFAVGAEIVTLATAPNQNPCPSSASNDHKPDAPKCAALNSRHTWSDQLFELAKVAISTGIATALQAQVADPSRKETL